MIRSFLGILLPLFLLPQMAAAQGAVSYSHKPLSDEACIVVYSCVKVDGQSILAIWVKAEHMAFSSRPRAHFLTFEDEELSLEGTMLTAPSGQDHVAVGNMLIPVEELPATALFLLNGEQWELIGHGVRRVSLATEPFAHEKTFKKDKIGRKLHGFFRDM